MLVWLWVAVVRALPYVVVHPSLSPWVPGGHKFTVGNVVGYIGDYDNLVLSRLRQFGWKVYPDVQVKQMEMFTQLPSPRHLARLSQRGPLDSELTYSWQLDVLGLGVVVYVLDSGIDVGHKEFQGRASNGINFVDEGPEDVNGHGTHVAGLVASATYGVAKNALVVLVKVLDYKGQLNLLTVILGLEWAANDAAKHGQPLVVNMSLGAMRLLALNAVVDEIALLGLVPVVAAGNENVNACLMSPALALAAITVGAIDDATDHIAPFSNFGHCVNIFAPGVAVTLITTESVVKYSGTLMASPQVAGLVALLLSRGVSDVGAALQEDCTNDAIRFGWLKRSPNRLAYVNAN